MRKTHDAELCDRIRALEDEVEGLKEDLKLHRYGGSHQVGPYWVYPYSTTAWPPNTSPWYSPTTTITYGVNTTDVVSVASGAQSTYTAGNVS